MYPQYVSRKYLKEKFDKLENSMRHVFEIDNDNLDDKIDINLVNKEKYAIQNYINSILNEIGML